MERDIWKGIITHKSLIQHTNVTLYYKELREEKNKNVPMMNRILKRKAIALAIKSN